MEIRKITIFWPEFDRFRRNLARRRSFAILNVASIKISKKLKIQDGGNRRLEKSKKSLYLGNGSTDFDQIWRGDAVHPVEPSDP